MGENVAILRGARHSHQNERLGFILEFNSKCASLSSRHERWRLAVGGWLRTAAEDVFFSGQPRTANR